MSQPTHAPSARPPDSADARMLAVETLGSVLWFAMDAAWMLGLHTLATVLVVPCLFAHALAFRYTHRAIVALAVTAAMNCWLAMNVSWMLGDVWSVPGLLLAAKLFAAAGAVLLVLAFGKSRWQPEARVLLLAGFRRVRLALQDRPKP